MPHTLFISDLHLQATHRQTTALFLDFMQQQAPQAEALYILGDLFEYWAGDDDLEQAFHQKICSAIRKLSQTGTAVFIMCGNRDFLMGQALAEACHATLLSDPTLIDLYGQPTILSHGDTLCTDDVDYQNFRKMVRDHSWQAQFLAQPLVERKLQIEALRTKSKQEKNKKNRALWTSIPMRFVLCCVKKLPDYYSRPHSSAGPSFNSPR